MITEELEKTGDERIERETERLIEYLEEEEKKKKAKTEDTRGRSNQAAASSNGGGSVEVQRSLRRSIPRADEQEESQ